LTSRRYLLVRGTPGDWGLQDLAVPLLERVLREARPRSVHALFDAGAGKSDAGVRALWDLVERHDPDLDVTLRACRYPHRLRAWVYNAVADFAAELDGDFEGCPNAAFAATKEDKAQEAFCLQNGVADAPFWSRTPCKRAIRSSSSSPLPSSPFSAAMIASSSRGTSPSPTKPTSTALLIIPSASNAKTSWPSRRKKPNS